MEPKVTAKHKVHHDVARVVILKAMMHVDQKVALQVGEQVPLVEKHLEAMIVRLLEDLLLGHGLDGIPLVFAILSLF